MSTSATEKEANLKPGGFTNRHGQYKWGAAMDQGPLVKEQIDGGAKFLAEFEKKIPVRAAFWLKADEDDWWYLYVASDDFINQKLDVGYGEVMRVAGGMRDPNFDPFRVKLISPSDPVAKPALDVLRLFPGRIATPIHRRNFGGASVDEVYIYPTLTPVS